MILRQIALLLVMSVLSFAQVTANGIPNQTLAGTPGALTLTNGSGLPVSSGISGLGTGIATWLATPSSANLITAATDETGTGALVFATSPTLVTPLLGTPTSGVMTNVTGTATNLTSGITNALKSATTTVDVSAATAPTINQILTATSGTAATWQTKAGISMFTGSTAVTSAFSATPTFSLADISSQSPVRFEPGAMTANVTSVTFSNKTAGAHFSVSWLQDGTGGRTVAYGASATNTCVVSPTLSITTTQLFEVMQDGTTVTGVGCTTNETGVQRGQEAAAPGTPAASAFETWGDSTNHVLSFKANNAATVSNTVVPQTCTNQVFTGLSAGGVFTCAAVAAATAITGVLPIVNGGIGTSTAAQTTQGAIPHLNNVVMLTSDFTSASSTALQLITGLTWTMPANLAVNMPFHCRLSYSQATADADAFGIQDVTIAPTDISAAGWAATSSTAIKATNLVALASTTATAIVSITPTVTTVLPVEFWGVIQQPSNASTSAINIMVQQTTTAARVIVVKKGSYCSIGF